MNEVRGDADGPILIQRQCDEFGPVLAVGSDDIDSAGATGAPMVINDQVQATRVAPDLCVMLRRPAGALGPRQNQRQGAPDPSSDRPVPSVENDQAWSIHGGTK